MILSTVFFSLPFLFATDPVVVRAVLEDRPLEVEATRRVVIDFELAPGWQVPHNEIVPPGELAAMLQIDAPPGIALTGPHATSFGELLRALFLDLPHERLLTAGRNEVEFRVLRALGPEAALEFNVLLYAAPVVSDGTAAGPRLIRRRYRLPLRPGATAVQIPPAPSAWGRADLLEIGDAIEAFELPTPGGAFDLADLVGELGEGLVVVTTQRSCL